jgi:hypothetical protein
VQVHYVEGVANHTDPESCAAYREVCGEALTGEHVGQPLSHEIFLIQDAGVPGLFCTRSRERDCTPEKAKPSDISCFVLIYPASF